MGDTHEEDFKTLVRALFQYIKAQHHLQNVNITGGNTEGPPGLSRISTWLESLVKPANPTRNTELMLYGNARNWLHMSLQILEEHYKRAILNSSQEISRLPLTQFPEAWTVAARWAKKNFKKITEATLTKARTELKNDLLGPLIPPPTIPLDTTSNPGEQIPPESPNSRQPATAESHKRPINEQQKNTPTKRPRPNPKSKQDSKTITNQTSPKTQPKSRNPPSPHSLTTNPPETSKFTRHLHFGDKNRSWDLEPSRPIIVMGDSNLSRLPQIHNNLIQVDSYPGARISHALHILKYKTQTSPRTQKVLLSFGLNDRTQGNPSLMSNTLTRLIGAAQSTFPNATIHIPLINYNTQLPTKAKGNIETLNTIIKETGKSIPALPRAHFQTLPDYIHWTPDTAKAVWTHWQTQLN